MSFEQAALAEPLGVGVHAVDQANVRRGDKVAILGAGPIGLSAAITLLDRGIEDVCVVDLSPARLEVARQARCPDHDRGLEDDGSLGRARRTPRPPALLRLELVGTTSSSRRRDRGPAREVVAHCAPAARVSVVALHRKPVTIDFMTVLMKQMSLTGSMDIPSVTSRCSS